MQTQRGMTLIELMITILIVAVIGGYAVPNYLSFNRNKAIEAYADKLSDNIKLAQSEAAALHQSVTVCARSANNGLSCDSGNNWSNGYLVASLNGGSIDTILASQAAPSNGVTLMNPGQAPLVFNSNGSMGSSTGFTVYAPSCSGAHQITINISAGGNISSSAAACS